MPADAFSGAYLIYLFLLHLLSPPLFLSLFSRSACSLFRSHLHYYINICRLNPLCPGRLWMLCSDCAFLPHPQRVRGDKHFISDMRWHNTAERWRKTKTQITPKEMHAVAMRMEIVCAVLRGSVSFVTWDETGESESKGEMAKKASKINCKVLQRTDREQQRQSHWTSRTLCDTYKRRHTPHFLCSSLFRWVLCSSLVSCPAHTVVSGWV